MSKVMVEPTELYVTVYRPIAGWKYMVITNAEGPEYTADRAWPTFKEAELDALEHAKEQGLAYVEYEGADKGELDSLNPVDKLQGLFGDTMIVVAIEDTPVGMLGSENSDGVIVDGIVGQA